MSSWTNYKIINYKIIKLLKKIMLRKCLVGQIVKYRLNTNIEKKIPLGIWSGHYT